MTEPLTNDEELVDAADDGESAVEETGVEASGAGPSDDADADVSETAAADDADADERGDELPDGGNPGRQSTDVSDDVAQTELVGLREEFEDLNDRHLRLVAEFNNFRRRSEQERMSAWGRAQADLVGNLLDVLDDLQRVADLELSNATVETIMEGIDLVERKFMRQLKEAGVEVIEPEGEAFDPERMEAMMRVPAEDDEQVDTVAQVFQKGYSLKGNLVRPARVSVYTKG